MAIDNVLQGRRKEILGIAHRYGANNVRVFGSRARGEGRPDSDFDILIAVGERTSLLDIIAIKQDLEDLLSSSVHVVTEDAISPYIREKVLRQAIAL
jgi:predicted nucleotidyltransferase